MINRTLSLVSTMYVHEISRTNERVPLYIYDYTIHMHMHALVSMYQ